MPSVVAYFPRNLAHMLIGAGFDGDRVGISFVGDSPHLQSEESVEDEFRHHLDEEYSGMSVGALWFPASRVLRLCDGSAYHTLLSEYCEEYFIEVTR